MKRKGRKSGSRRTPYQAMQTGDDVAGRHDPKMFAGLAHFFKMEDTIGTITREDAVDYITGMTMDAIFQAKNPNTNCGLNNVSTSISVEALKDSGYKPCSQPDLGTGGANPAVASAEFKNLGSDDWLFMAVGHNLPSAASGTQIAFGWPLADVTGNGSFIHMNAGLYQSGSYTGADTTLVKDTNGNSIDFPEAQAFSDGNKAGLANGHSSGSYEPMQWMMYKEGNKITRRIRRFLTNEILIDTVDCSSLTGDIHPNAGYFWFDFVTYGVPLFHFTQGIPDRILEYADWMGDDWRNNPLDKKIHPNLLVHI